MTDERKITITAAEIAVPPVLAATPPVAAAAPPQSRYSLPAWAAALMALTVFCLPLLCLCAIVLRLAHRKRPEALRQWDRLLCTLFIVSGLLTSLAVIYTLDVSGRRGLTLRAMEARGMEARPMRLTRALPNFPSPLPLTAERLAEEAYNAVYIAAPDSADAAEPAYKENVPIGAATLLMADRDGYLLATSRHVVDAEGTFGLRFSAEHMALFAHDGALGRAEVAARHETSDLALLWVPRADGGAFFRQPIANDADVATGKQVFVIGHPQRFFFTLSSGLVSRTEDRDILQFSAPVSPGNSGGPVYDTSGNLLGVVAWMVDRAQNPNAENLNFAVRASRLLSTSGWKFSGPGKAKLEAFLKMQAAAAPSR